MKLRSLSSDAYWYITHCKYVVNYLLKVNYLLRILLFDCCFLIAVYIHLKIWLWKNKIKPLKWYDNMNKAKAESLKASSFTEIIEHFNLNPSAATHFMFSIHFEVHTFSRQIHSTQPHTIYGHFMLIWSFSFLKVLFDILYTASVYFSFLSYYGPIEVCRRPDYASIFNQNSSPIILIL
jgi:hypothetical protein